MFRSLAPLAVALAFLAGCATTAAPTNVADTASRTPQLSTLSKLIADAGLTETLRGAGPYTVFAPSDDAFKAVPAKTMAETQVVVMNFCLIFGSTGAPGSPPSPLSMPASAWLTTPRGRTANSTVHQMVK